MNEIFCQSRHFHCVGESGHFHVIVLHLDTLGDALQCPSRSKGTTHSAEFGHLWSTSLPPPRRVSLSLRCCRMSANYVSELFLLKSFCNPDRQCGCFSQLCLKCFSLVSLSDMVTHSVATHKAPKQM